MKKFFLIVPLILCLFFKSLADEGMWLPLLLGQQVYNDMVKKGLKLTKEQLYSINKASLKDAVIIFGSGCTGVIVSSEGLIFTNHHCGYEVISAASTIDHNYLRDGFYARNREEEIPAEGLTVQFLLRIDDITKEVMDSLQGLTGAERAQRLQRVIQGINKRFSDTANSIEARVSSLFKGNQFLVFTYSRYRDIRLVGAPSESIGDFGGDTDNWQWPRHAGDFSIFRVYMSKDGKPSRYAAGNVPLKPKWFLPISLKGIKEGDYAMIYGYPGNTNRYETSFGIKQKIEIEDPVLVKLRDVRMKYMLEEMKKDPIIRLKLAPSYLIISNHWKFYNGEKKLLIKYDIYDQKKREEEKFVNWAKGKPEFENIFQDWGKTYDTWRPYSKSRVYLNEGIYGIPLIHFAASLLQLETAMVSTRVTTLELNKALVVADEGRKKFMEEEDKISDQNTLATMIRMYYEDVQKDQHPTGFYNDLRNNYGDLKDASTYKKFAADVFNKTMIFDDARWNEFISHPDANKLQQDPAFAIASTFIKNYESKYYPYYQQFFFKNNELGRLYLKGIMQMDTVKSKKLYPDATFTMRVTFGNVKSYTSQDAVHYNYVTTSKGVLEKYVPGDYEFDLPLKAVELMRKKDFGPYADKSMKDLVVCFITTNDITGGNSGSPVINANGELIGLSFDGNTEAMDNKISYDKDLNRTICVDIRFVLWCIDKLGGAQNIVRELKMVK